MKKVFALFISLCLLLSAVAYADEAKPILTMGTNAAFPPYEFYEDDKIVGIDAEVAAAIADKLNMELVITDMDFEGLVAAVASGKIDIAMAGMTVTEERLQSVNFSISYATGIQSIIVKEGSEIKSVDDLANAGLIGVQQGTTGDIYCADEFGAEHVSAYKTGNDAVMALIAGKVDCVVIDNEPAKAYVAANEGLIMLDTEYAVEDYAIAVGLENTELLDAINAALEELFADNTVANIIAKYITAD